MRNLMNLTMGGKGGKRENRTTADSTPPDSEKRGARNHDVNEPEDLTLEAIPYHEPGELQEKDVEKAFKAEGFPEWMSVTATLEKKPSREREKKPGEPPEPNEDNVILDAKTGLIGVADGLGGQGNGREASMTVEKVLPQHFSESLEQLAETTNKELVRELSAIQAAKFSMLGKDLQAERQREIANKMELIAARDPELLRKAMALANGLKKTSADVQTSKGMSAISVGLIHESSNGRRYAIVAGIGDCGAYKRRKDGSMRDLLSEDSLYSHLRLSGKLPSDLIAEMKIDPEKEFPIEVVPGVEKKFTWQKLNVRMTQALGGNDTPEPAFAIIEIRDEEELLFVSDGIKDKYEDANGETNLALLSKTLGTGSTDLEQLDHLRTDAQKITTKVKERDDIGAVRIQVGSAKREQKAA